MDFDTLIDKEYISSSSTENFLDNESFQKKHLSLIIIKVKNRICSI